MGLAFPNGILFTLPLYSDPNSMIQGAGGAPSGTVVWRTGAPQGSIHLQGATRASVAGPRRTRGSPSNSCRRGLPER